MVISIEGWIGFIMSLQKDEAIVLSKRAYGESDRIIRLFTMSGGKISAIAKGGSKSQRRFMNTLEPFNHISVEYFRKPGKGMARIENADIIESNSGIEVSLKKIYSASFFVEFTDRLTKEGEKNIELFTELKDIVQDVKRADFTSSDIIYHLLKMLSQLGFMPNFNNCVYCGRQISDEKKIFFSKERGGILCPSCSNSLPFKVYPEGIIPRLSLFANGERFATDLEVVRHIQDMMEGFISFHLDVDIKSYRFLKSFI